MRSEPRSGGSAPASPKTPCGQAKRLSATLALALVGEEAIDIAPVGDSGIRINGSRILQVKKDLDVITSARPPRPGR